MELQSYRNAIREAIRLGLEGEAIAGIDFLIDAFPELAAEVSE